MDNTLRVRFRSFRFGALCTNQKELVRKYGPLVAEKVEVRLSQLSSVANLEEMRYLPGRCHELKGARSGELSITLYGGFRLVLLPGNPDTRETAGLDWSSVTEVIVTEIEDYH